VGERWVAVENIAAVHRSLLPSHCSLSPFTVSVSVTIRCCRSRSTVTVLCCHYRYRYRYRPRGDPVVTLWCYMGVSSQNIAIYAGVPDPGPLWCRKIELNGHFRAVQLNGDGSELGRYIFFSHSCLLCHHMASLHLNSWEMMSLNSQSKLLRRSGHIWQVGTWKNWHEWNAVQSREWSAQFGRWWHNL
jgi:hypothetical protein